MSHNGRGERNARYLLLSVAVNAVAGCACDDRFYCEEALRCDAGSGTEQGDVARDAAPARTEAAPEAGEPETPALDSGATSTLTIIDAGGPAQEHGDASRVDAEASPVVDASASSSVRDSAAVQECDASAATCSCPEGYAATGSQACLPLLVELQPSRGTLDMAFSPELFDYELRLPIFIETVTLVLRGPEGAEINVDGTRVDTEQWASPALSLGESSIEIEVLGPEGSNSYTLRVNRGAPESYLKAFNAEPDDQFGSAVAVSADGSTLAIGADGESAAGTNPNDNTATSAGAVFVFRRVDGAWHQEEYIKASNADEGDAFGRSIALSAKGDTLAVGAPLEAGSDAGIGADQNDNAAPSAGAVYIFQKSANGWEQQAYVKASNAQAGDAFGSSVSLSANGDTLAVGAPAEAGGDTGVGADPTDNTAFLAGAAYVLQRAAGVWRQQAYVKASNAEEADGFGSSVALAGDGETLAIGAYGEASNGQSEDDNSAYYAGAVYVFGRSEETWAQEAYLKASNAGEFDSFGRSVALTQDGNLLAIGADGEASASPASDPDDDSATYAGAAYLFEREQGAWAEANYLKASNPQADDRFGTSMALAADGSVLVVGAPFEDSSGMSGTDNSASSAGAAYVFLPADGSWAQSAYLKASNAGEDDSFAQTLSLSALGDVLVVGAEDEAGSGAGLMDDMAPGAGASYVFW